MLIKKILFLIILSTVICSCSNLLSPPPISDESVYFENEYFSIWYPKGWDITTGTLGGASNIVNLIFYEPRYRKHSVNVIILDSGGESIMNIIRGDLFQKYVANERRFMEDFGISGVSSRKTSLYLDGRLAEDIITEGSNEKGTIEKHMIILDVNANVGAQILYGCYFANEATKERMRRIVESIHFK